MARHYLILKEFGFRKKNIVPLFETSIVQNRTFPFINKLLIRIIFLKKQDEFEFYMKYMNAVLNIV